MQIGAKAWIKKKNSESWIELIWCLLEDSHNYIINMTEWTLDNFWSCPQWWHVYLLKLINIMCTKYADIIVKTLHQRSTVLVNDFCPPKCFSCHFFCCCFFSVSDKYFGLPEFQSITIQKNWFNKSQNSRFGSYCGFWVTDWISKKIKYLI